MREKKPKQLYTISAFTENSPGVLHRLVTTFTKRKVNIESLTVSETERHGISRFTIVVLVDEDLIQTIVKQIQRIIEVKDAFACVNEDLVFKEIAFIRVSACAAADRAKVEEHAERYGARVIHADVDSVIVEATGEADEIKSLYRILEPHGIEEFIQSGRIALCKHKETVQA